MLVQSQSCNERMFMVDEYSQTNLYARVLVHNPVVVVYFILSQ